MESSKIRLLMEKIQKIRSKLEDLDICGPVPYLDEAIENIERAIDELDIYNG